jgi:DNA primase small subunit
MVEGWSRFALRFSDYYKSLDSTEIWVPPRLRNREWMFIPWGSRPPDRHRGFIDKQGLHDYLKQRSPHSCFHSTAYYRLPNERKMIDKDWLGADLIFDLDGDHLPGVSDNDFPTMISKIQEQAWTLWSEFLEPEFGFKEKYVQTSFSGHRGFHIHVRDPSLLHIDSNARRQLVNYIRGEGINVQTSLSGPDSGWKNRISDGISSVTHKLKVIHEKGSDHKLFLGELQSALEISAKSPGSTIRKVSTNKIKEIAELADEERLSRLSSDNKLRVFGEKNTAIFWEMVKGDNSVVLGSAGETDEAVTVDVKRVIRWIGSLHGKCGLRVTEMPLERLNPNFSNSFNPLEESIVFSSDKKSKILLNKDDVTAELGGVRVEGNAGDIVETPESLSTFLVLKGWGSIVN